MMFIPAEHDLQCAILEYLSYIKHPDTVIFSVPNGGWRTQTTAIRLKKEGLLPGVSDLVVVGPGGAVAFIEVKVPGGRQSPAQVEFERRINRAGGTYAIVRSIWDAKDVLEDLGALR